MHELVKIEVKQELVVLMGDLNKHVGDIIEGNHSKVTFGGQLIRNLLKTEKYQLVNSSSKVVGGPFTRYDPSDPKCEGKMSCLGLVIVSKDLLCHVEKLFIDKKQTISACRPISKNKMVYPDHFPLLLVFKNLQLKSRQQKNGCKITMWNTNKDGGWEKYKELTEDNTKLQEVAVDSSEDPDHMMNKIDKELNRIKYIAFGKVKLIQKPKVNKILEGCKMKKSHALMIFLMMILSLMKR